MEKIMDMDTGLVWGNTPTVISTHGQRRIVRLIFGRRPYNSFSNFSRIIIGRMRGLRFTAILRARKESLTICWLTITIVRKSQTEAR